ncbi:SulP family inorganic anion transporter [Nocardioides luteus]|uniref:Sodium-independent anion transporter n=1 Tax=Nocardioides luteus TaxID=1844 RepID=A0A1J4N7Z0_9ACTN|nr:sulfate permease [Nocardioides luteus]OIJ27635.1 sodium-independent anion transporter [Nocardioides luteus]
MDVRQVLPSWTRGYQRRWLWSDLLAGVTITAYLVPQVMAYAELAGLPPETGLWACVGAMLVYGFLGTSRLLSVGPESTTALMTAAAIGATPAAAQDPGSFAATLALVVAAICVVGWLARVSVLAELFSRPVLVGYMAGIAVLMVVSQLDNLTGVQVEGDGVLSELASFVRNLDQVHLPTLLLGLGAAAAMIIGSLLAPRAPVALLGMLAATGLVALLGEGHGLRLVGEISIRPPTPGLPDLDPGLLVSMLAPALGVAFVGYTDNILTGRAFAGRDDHVDAHRELLALGGANVGSALLHGFPVSSSGSRTAIGHAVGGRTQLTSYVTAAATVAAVLLLAPVLEAFPQAALGAVVVYAATKLVEVGELRRFARFRRSELVLALVATVAVLVAGVMWGVLIAVGLSVLDLLRRVAHPHDAVLGLVPGLAGMHDVDDYPDAEEVPGLLVYRYDSPLFFANAEDFRTRALAAVDDAAWPVEWFLLNVEANVEVDITAVDALESLRRALADRGVVLAIARIKQDLRASLAPSGILDRIGEDHLFPTLPTAVEAYRRRER